MFGDVPKIHSSIESLSNNPSVVSIGDQMLNPAFIPESNLPSSRATHLQSSEATDNFGSAAVDIDLLEKEIAAKEQARREQQFVDLSGDIAGATHTRRSKNFDPSLETDFDTLDEPVWDTVKRDLRTVITKFCHVLMPRNNQQLLRDWDLWGPLFICVFFSLLLQGGVNGNGPHFTEVFSLTFFGTCVVTLNIKLLGGHISFFQSLCVLGYCLSAPGVAALICIFIEMIAAKSTFLFLIRLLVTATGFLWATHGMYFITALKPCERNIRES